MEDKSSKDKVKEEVLEGTDEKRCLTNMISRRK